MRKYENEKICINHNMSVRSLCHGAGGNGERRSRNVQRYIANRRHSLCE